MGGLLDKGVPLAGDDQLALVLQADGGVEDGALRLLHAAQPGEEEIIDTLTRQVCVDFHNLGFLACG